MTPNSNGCYFYKVMRLSDYFCGIPVRLRSPLAAATTANRINGAASSMLIPWSEGVIGGVRFGLVRLRVRRTMLDYNMKPVLAGRVPQDRSGSFLRLRYRAPLPAYLFFPLWYLIWLGLFLTFLLLPAVGETRRDEVVTAMVSALLFALPLAIHRWVPENPAKNCQT